MRLNKAEFLLVNNPVRHIIQDKYEAKIFRSMSSITNIERALEIGCSTGYGTKIIKKHFNPKKIIAIDLDEQMIRIAQKRNTDATVSFKAMDASRLDFPDNYFDAIFDFGIIHHIPNWRDCLKELKRVLKPNGEVILEEASIESFTKDIGKLWRKILDHPYHQMFTPDEFTNFMAETGFRIENYKTFNPLHFLRFFSLNAKILK